MKNYLKSRLLITALIFVPVAIAHAPQLIAESTATDKTITFVPPPPPPDRSASGDRGEAASRGCQTGDRSLTALVPSYQEEIRLNQAETIPITKVWGLTTAKYPTFWFYIPYEASAIASIEFVLKDESAKPRKIAYRNFLSHPEKPGIIGISTKSLNVPLELTKANQKKMYHWFLKVKVRCHQQQSTQLDFVEGWIERKELNAKCSDLQNHSTPLKKAAFYAEKGIWYDAVTNLAKLSSVKPSIEYSEETLCEAVSFRTPPLSVNSKNNSVDFAAAWKSLLQSVDLEDLANYPFIDCCLQIE